MLDDDDTEVIMEFLVECYEGLDQLDQDLVALEDAPADAQLLDRIFRCVHTIKGTSGFLAFTHLEKIAHVGENLLSQLRDGKLFVNADIISALLSTIDAFRELLQSIELTGAEHEADYRELIALLAALNDGKCAESLIANAEPQMSEAVGTPAPAEDDVSAAIEVALAANAISSLDPVPQSSPVGTPPPAVEAVPAAATPKPKAEKSSDQGAVKSPVTNNHIRVDVRLLDKLMNLVGELVLVRNQVVQFTQNEDESNVVAVSQRLNQVTTELQEGIMQTRMQPIGTVWSKFPRVVRDLSVQCGKQVEIVMEGKGTELDKTLIEAIKDPLTHAVRNSIDHGIESPDVRTKAGKDPTGTLTLRSYHEGGQVNIEISDDGAGINCVKVRERAIERGLVSYEEAQAMTERESIALLFRPGFSTAAAVTNVSGRGVGMDVVKTSIEKIGGTVDLHSVLGTGTTLKIKIPLTLAIVPALLIESSNDIYAIPQVSLLQLVRLEGKQIDEKIKKVLGTPVFNLRGKLLPLVYLNEQLELSDDLPEAEERVLNIVVLQADDRQFGLAVDKINDTEEIVVKPLGQQLKGLKAFSGATILGDGKVALILDVLGLAQKSGVISDVVDRKISDLQRDGEATKENIESLLLFGKGTGEKMALPLRQVERLEEFQRKDLETSGEFHVVQYRGEVMPLIHVSQIVPNVTADMEEHSHLSVIVYSYETGRVGLIVDEILDIVYIAMPAIENKSSESLLGSVVVQDKVTDILNVDCALGNGRISAPTLLGAQK